MDKASDKECVIATVSGPRRRPVVEAGILIQADLATVWQCMTGWQDYGSWNPFIVRVDLLPGRPGRPQQMRFRLVWYDGRRGSSLEEMVAAEAPREGQAELRYRFASWLARLGLVQATRIQRLEQEGTQVRYWTQEAYVGLLAWLVPLEAVRRGFAAQAQALARTCAARSAGKT